MSSPELLITLADLVTRNPAAAPVLERLRLDYCCGGRQSIEEAARVAGLDPEFVLAQITAIDSGPSTITDWSQYDASQMIDHVVTTHHDYLAKELPRLEELAIKVADVHGSNHPELDEVRTLVSALRTDLEPHLAKEERVLFPMIRELATASASVPDFHCGTLRHPIAVMMLEHESTGELLERIRTTTADFAVPADGCASYRALYSGLEQLESDTHLHVHKENNVLFPLVVAMETALSERGH